MKGKHVATFSDSALAMTSNEEDNLRLQMAGLDEIGIYIFLVEDEGNPSNLMGIEEEHLKQIQEDIQKRLKERDEAR